MYMYTYSCTGGIRALIGRLYVYIRIYVYIPIYVHVYNIYIYIIYICSYSYNHSRRMKTGVDLNARIGIATGNAVAGMLGDLQPRFSVQVYTYAYICVYMYI